MREQIQRFMQEFPQAKAQAFGNNPFGDFIRSDLPEKIYETNLVDRKKYLIEASPGKGNWSTVPWICIFDRSITTSARKEVYICYLLSKDSERLYLTFNQGCTEIKETHSRRETIEIMHRKSEHVRSTISNRGFLSGSDIDLGEGLTELGIFYREGTIFYKRYDVTNIPEESVLRDDLSRMMQIYADYARSLHPDNRLGVFDSWTIVDETTAIKNCDKSFFDYHGSGLPKGICWFFDAENLTQGQVIHPKLLYQGTVYEGTIRAESADTARVRLFWPSELDKLLQPYRSVNAQAIFNRRADNTYELSMKGDEEPMSTREILERIKAFIAAKGFSYDNGLIENFYLSLKSKPFVILAGTSGTGKTRLVRLFAEAIGAHYHQVAVRPDWSDSTDLFGHVDLNGHFVPGAILDFLHEAQSDIDSPYILCLDEMNLARVEYYLSDFLSVIETRDLIDGKIVTEPLLSLGAYGSDQKAREKYGVINFPENLYIVGTVNMDETTFPFSRKVLDRANTIEFSEVDLIPSWSDSPDIPAKLTLPNSFLRSSRLLLHQIPEEDRPFVDEICAELEKLNRILRSANAHVGYRVRDEIVFYLLNNHVGSILDEKVALDNEILQKILPRLQGSSASVRKMLCDLFTEIAGDYEGYQTESNNTADRMMDMLRKNGQIRYPRSARKIAFMVRRFEEDGFTSYWL